MKPITVLFLCTGNSCRSQMAEGWAQAISSDAIEFYSAGIEAHGLNPNAVAVMQEVGIDIRRQHSQRIDELELTEFDYVFAVCDNAEHNCPAQLGKNMYHHQFDDPPLLARNAISREQELGYFRQVRDQIKEWVAALPQQIANNQIISKI